MARQFFIIRIFILTFSTFLICSCNKLVPSLNIPILPTDTSDNNETPAITSIGTPIGNPASATIGPSGGSLVSPDGKLTLTIPPGALDNQLDISIQPITNEAPGGFSVGYDLTPNGTKFKIPVTLSFQYSDDDVNGTHPYFIDLATQDSLDEWKILANQKNVDTIAKTLSVITTHFSSYVPVQSIKMEFGQFEFQDGESNFIKLTEKPFTSSPAQDPNDNNDFLPALPNNRKQVPDNEVSHWSLNDQGKTTVYGSITGDGANVTFQAPDPIEDEERVKVSVELNGNYFYWMNGKLIKATHLIIIGHLKLIKEYNFEIKMEADLSGTNPCFIDKYVDLVTMMVAVKKDVVTIPTSGISNQQPSTNPTSGHDASGTEICSWLPDTFGVLNLKSATGSVTPTGNIEPGTRKLVLINCNHQQTLSPKWVVKYQDGDTTQTGGDPDPGFVPLVSFILRDSAQEYEEIAPSTGMGSGVIRYVITPKN